VVLVRRATRSACAAALPGRASVSPATTGRGRAAAGVRRELAAAVRGAAGSLAIDCLSLACYERKTSNLAHVAEPRIDAHQAMRIVRRLSMFGKGGVRMTPAF